MASKSANISFAHANKSTQVTDQVTALGYSIRNPRKPLHMERAYIEQSITPLKQPKQALPHAAREHPGKKLVWGIYSV
jgi:hypothetical protein